MAFILRGVKTRDINPRYAVWLGGSSKITMPGGISMFALISSRIVPWLEIRLA